jgi:hypothetical protein
MTEFTQTQREGLKWPSAHVLPDGRVAIDGSRWDDMSKEGL